MPASVQESSTAQHFGTATLGEGASAAQAGDIGLAGRGLAGHDQSMACRRLLHPCGVEQLDLNAGALPGTRVFGNDECYVRNGFTAGSLDGDPLRR